MRCRLGNTALIVQHGAPARCRWPGENGVPENHVARRPNFPECDCTQACAGEAKPRRLALAEWILISCILAATAIAIWRLVALGGSHA
ncbi:hypothetical protein [Nitratireductor sp. GCM10026969]|uniref:hypothetical protein n=1 Tax=Nitratireductor sp. GCM10026969 TaxID=3252645 RepID=UPI003620D742